MNLLQNVVSPMEGSYHLVPFVQRLTLLINFHPLLDTVKASY